MQNALVCESPLAKRVRVLERVIDDLLTKTLFDYANDGYVGPGSPLLPTRDFKMRKEVVLLRRILRSTTEEVENKKSQMDEKVAKAKIFKVTIERYVVSESDGFAENQIYHYDEHLDGCEEEYRLLKSPIIGIEEISLNDDRIKDIDLDHLGEVLSRFEEEVG